MTIDEFKNIDLRVANVIAAERVEGSEKLLKLQIDLGDEKRQLVAGVGKVYTPEQMVGKQIVVVANLEPRKFKLGQVELESQGMLLAAGDSEDHPVFLTVEREAKTGSKIT